MTRRERQLQFERVMAVWLARVGAEATLVLPTGETLRVRLRRAAPPTFGEPLVRVEADVLEGPPTVGGTVVF